MAAHRAIRQKIFSPLQLLQSGEMNPPPWLPPEVDREPKLAKLANIMEVTVLVAKNRLSELLRRAERGEEVLIRRGRKGDLFRLSPAKPKVRRTLTPDPRWAGKISYTDESIWESEWKDEA